MKYKSLTAGIVVSPEWEKLLGSVKVSPEKHRRKGYNVVYAPAIMGDKTCQAYGMLNRLRNKKSNQLL